MKGQGQARTETIIHLRAFALGVCPSWITLSSFILIAVMTTEGPRFILLTGYQVSLPQFHGCWQKTCGFWVTDRGLYYSQ